VDRVSSSQGAEPHIFPSFLAAEKNTQKEGTRKAQPNNYFVNDRA